MRRGRVALLVSAAILVAITVGAWPQASAAEGRDSTRPEFVPGEILMKFKPSAQAVGMTALKGDLGAVTLTTFNTRAEHWRLGPGVNVEQAIQRLLASGLVEYAEPNYIVSAELVPNDPRFSELYGMNNTGQNGGTPDADIDAPEAWSQSTGSSSVIVAGIDTGCDYNHPDLAANIWTNPGEIPGNGIDDDANGFVDDVHGYDFVNNDGDPFDDHGHGTHTAGTIGAVGDNGIGVTGVAWNVKIMCLKFLAKSGSGTTAGAVSAVQYATQMGANLSNNSWGGGDYSQTLYDAIAAAGAANIAFVASAGNSSQDNDLAAKYPAGYDLANIISVASTDRNDALSSFSCWGATTVDLAAPGSSILSTMPGNTYSVLSGTSMAAPHVSGVAALIHAVYPGVQVDRLKAMLLNSVDRKASLAGKCVSGGRLNAYIAIRVPDSIPPGMIVNLATRTPGSTTMGLAWTSSGDDGNVGTAGWYEVRYSTAPIDDSNWAAATRAGNEPSPLVSGSPQSMEIRDLAPETLYYFAIRAFDEWANPGPISNLATGTTLTAPIVGVAPTSVSAELLTGQQTDRTVVLSNVNPSTSTLDYVVATPSFGEPQAASPPDTPVIENQGGPDAFGYRWIDSDDPAGPVFDWTDISTTGTMLDLGGDQTSLPIPLGFTFPFYGGLFDSIRVNTNGWLTLDDPNNSFFFYNFPLPTNNGPRNMVAPFWDDLNRGSTGQIYYQSFGDKAIVQWDGVYTYNLSGGPHTFQAILKSDGTITFQYLELTGNVAACTVGTQNADRTIGLQIAYNQAYLHDHLAVLIYAIPHWLTVTPTTGRLNAGESAPLNFHFDAAGLQGGTLPATVNIETNVGVFPVTATLDVQGAPDASVKPTSLPYGERFLGTSSTQTLLVLNRGMDTLHVTDVLPSHPEIAADPRTFNVAPYGSQEVQVTWTPSTLGPFSGSVTVQSDDAGEPNLVVPVTGYVNPPAVMVVTPSSFDVTLFTGNQTTRSLNVRNGGGSNLVVDAVVDLEGALVSTDEDTFGSGGPDAFGYRWTDSDESGGPTFAWQDISATGTPVLGTGGSPLTGDNVLSAAIDIGMTFPFYGNNFSALKVCTNGWITFDTTSTSTAFGNLALPNTTLPKNSIALFWDDLIFRVTGGSYPRTSRAYWKNDGNKVILQFTNVYRFGGAVTDDLNFQVLLYPDGKIVVQYLTMTTGSLTGATVGVQNETRTIGLNVVNNAAYVKNNLAVRISLRPDWLWVTPARRTIPPGGSYDFTVTFDSTLRQGGVLDGAVVLTNNAPEQQRVPARLTVVGAPILRVIPESYAYGTRFTGYPHMTQFELVNQGTDTLTVGTVESTDPTLSVLDTEGEQSVPEAGFMLPPGASRLFNLQWSPITPMTLDAAVRVVSDDPQRPEVLMPVTGTAIPQPVAAWSPASFTESLRVGDVVHRTLHLENLEGSDLTYFISVRDNSGTQVVVYPAFELLEGEEDPREGVLGSGGPDGFGYTWKDSDDPNGPAFDWIDISAVGTRVPFGSSTTDQNLGPYPIGFSFPFYGIGFDTFRVCNNGFLSFTSGDTDAINDPLPTVNAPENLVAGFWDDLVHDTSIGAAVYYHYDGTKTIVQYNNMRLAAVGSQGTFTFQIILYPSGDIVYQYRTLGTNNLASHTVGIQNVYKNDGLTVVYNRAGYLHANMAIRIRPLDWLTVSPDHGVVAPGTAADLDVTFDTTRMIGGDYAASIDIRTNDPAHSLIGVPVSLHLTGIPDISATPPSLTFPMTYVGYTRTLATTIKNVGTDVLTVTGVSTQGDFTQTGLMTPVMLPVGASVPVTVTFAPTDSGTRTGSVDVTSDDPDEPTFSIPLEGVALFPPELAVSPDSLPVFLPPATQTTRTLQVCNTGGADLNWTSTSSTPFNSGPGSPSVFGYRWADSDSVGGPVFNWVDITAVGTRVTSLDQNDKNATGIPIGFPFPFYGNSFTTLTVSTNGWLSFSYTATNSFFNNSALPNSGNAPPDMLAPWWDDLDFRATSGSGRVYYYNDGSRFILSYVNVPRPPNTPGGPYTFQVILYPSGRIVYQYLSMQSTVLNQATIGLQNQTRNDGVTVVYNNAYVHNNLAIAFQPVPRWATYSPTAGVVPAGECRDVTVTLGSTGLAHGVEEATIRFQANNDPYLAFRDVPVTLTVNQKPVADAGTPQTLECTGGRSASGTLHGTGTDADSDPLTFAWTAPGIAFDNPASANPTATFPLGTTTSTLVVNDGYENSDPDTVDMTVVDTTPPSIVCPAPVTSECQVNGMSTVAVPPATASDVCQAVMVVNNHTAGGADASGVYPLGTTLVTFTATDGSGNTASCQTSVTVVDTTPPTITAEATPGFLWPPNHKMSDVGFNVVATDACDPNPAIVLVSATSSEPDDAQGGGDGATTNDIQGTAIGTADFMVQLRSERDGHGTGRVYTVTYRATDHSGNATSTSETVPVPHDLGQVVEPLDLRIEGKQSTSVSWSTVQGAESYDVIRGNLENLRIDGSNVDLGVVNCIVRNTVNTTTTGHEDNAIPAPGKAFFYAVQFFDGIQDSSYGSESVGRARVVGDGNCP